jgi:hypothetical protein
MTDIRTDSAARPGKRTAADYAMLRGVDLLKMLADLRQERALIEEAIVALERLALGRGKRPGRPPAWMTAASVPKRRGRPLGSKNKPRDVASPA